MYHITRHLRNAFAGTTAMLLPLQAVAGSAVFIEKIGRFQTVIERGITILFVVATIVFLWGIVTYLTAGGNEEKIKKGRTFMIFGIVGLAVMLSVWGLVFLLVNTFEVGQEGDTIPENVSAY